MTRASIKLRFAAALLVSAGFAGCGSDDGNGGDDGDTTAYKDTLKFTFDPVYSAYDNGTHVYQVPVLLDQAVFDSSAIDYVDPESVKWDVDKNFATTEPFPDYPGAVLLTTKKAGTTTVTATAKTKSGENVRGRVELKITAASPDEWELGEQRYNNMVMFELSAFRGAMSMGMGMGMFNLAELIPRNTSCAMCHNNNGGPTALTVEHTPLQTGGYSDEELIQIFTTGAKPMGAGFNSPVLRNFPESIANSIYTTLHTWEIAPEVERGIVYKLRSITPKKQEEIDLGRIRMMFANRGMMGTGMGMDAAAGAAAPAP